MFQALQEMLLLMAAASHNNYTKSIHLFLQRMQPLYQDSLFQHGLHVVRRSDRFWAGLSTDLYIEQVLMKSLKSTGGCGNGETL